MRSDHALGDRFELLARLGAGGMGDVYRARDRERGQDIALKVLPALDATALMRFKNEFRALHDVVHPNLVRLHELHEHHGTWFFTMQLVDGVVLLQWVGGDETRLREVLPQIAHALQRLHDRGLVHRDVKPSNILVTPDGKAVLLDFGLVAPAWSPGEGAGTPSFMAPEQIEGHITPASDWYAFGVLMFRALTGSMPFAGKTDDVLRAKATRSAPRVDSVNPEAPRDLAMLADALLARRPTERPNGRAVLAALGEGREASDVVRTILVGRDRELAELQRAFADRMRGYAFAVGVVGESGIGKTSLLRTFAEDLEQAGSAWVLRGRCWERESVPYKGFDGVIDELVALLEAEDVALDPHGWAAILVQAFPVLQRLPAFAATPVVQEVGGRETAARVSGGIRWLLAEVARRQPLAVVIDDLQWADRDTMALLRGVLEPPLPNVLLVVGAREPTAIDPRAVVRTIELSPLSPADTATLVDMVGRELGHTIDATTIAKESAGHPLLAAELARHAAATGEVGPIAFEEIVLRITERFGPEARKVATLISLAHAPISVSDAAHAAALPPATFFDAIAALRAAQVIATTGEASAMRLEPSHDRIRRAIVADVGDEERRAVHEAIAKALEHGGAADPELLALHWDDAGAPATAARHALRAAEQAEVALAFHRAARLYKWVGTLAPDRREVRVRYAECLAQAGLGVDAADAYLACARDADGATALDLRRRAMQQLLLMGHNARALELFDELTRELSIPNPTRPGRLVVGLLARRAAIRFRKAELPNRPPGSMREIDQVRLDVMWDAAVGLALLDPLRAFYFHSLVLESSLRIGDNPRVARALLAEAPYLAARARPRRRLDRLVELSDLAAKLTSFPALSPLARGTIAFFFGRWRECRHQLDKCERLLLQERPRMVAEGVGPPQLLDITRRFQLVSHVYLGQLHEVARRLPELLVDALERNDVAAATHLRSGVQTVVHLAFDRVDVAERDADEAFRPWRDGRVGVPHFMDVQARVALAIYTGRPDDAYREVEQRWPALAHARLFRVSYMHITMLDFRARAALAAAKVATGSTRDKLLREATRCANELTASRAIWARPLGDAIRGGVAWCAEDRAGAIAHLDRAIAGFDTADMALHAANARGLRARVAGNSQEEAAERRVLATAGVVDVDRFSHLLLPH